MDRVCWKLSVINISTNEQWFEKRDATTWTVNNICLNSQAQSHRHAWKRNKETQLAPTTVKAQCGLSSMHWLSNRYYKWSKWFNEEWWEFCFCLLTWWQKSKQSRLTWKGTAKKSHGCRHGWVCICMALDIWIPSKFSAHIIKF